MPLPGMRCPPVCGHLSYRAQRKVARPSHRVLQLQMDALAGQFKNLTKTTLHAVKQLDPKTKRTRRGRRGFYY